MPISRRFIPLLTLTAAVALTGACSSTDHSAGRVAATSAEKGAEKGAANSQAATDLYVDPDSNPARWARDNAGDGRAARIKAAIADKPIARWFGDWDNDIAGAVSGYVGAAQTAGKTPVLVAYNVPGRDCNGHSDGGAGDAAAYRTWIDKFAGGIGDRPAIVVVEPDAVAQLDCIPEGERQLRLDLMKYAVDQLKAKASNAWTYLDGGNAKWIAAATMAQRLKDAGITNARGFSVNVSNYYTTAESDAYANDVNNALGTAKKYVIDTSRNGNGSNGEWCNPAGRKLGAAPQPGTGGAELELWVKVPGDSDGPCGIGPNVPAGQFSPDLAVHLIDGN
ncbi:glycoside hydrolase family 6 protein [Actinomadura barringtoniae]|uniref:glycoside hydrolase family 6 protein n=1 Tax=Actinomadura barringtoniae TaxID=1427535 RepID=UPI0027DB2EC9|nr:glycoside hydrolase family 6 protein [Actinomadura barringtoniae]